MRARSLEELTLKIQNTRERLLASSMICGAALLGFSATSANAAAAAAAAGEVSEIVVTGTRIPSPNLTSIAPVTTVGNADIKAQGVTIASRAFPDKAGRLRIHARGGRYDFDYASPRGAWKI